MNTKPAPTRKAWTDEEIGYVQDTYGLTAKTVAGKLARSTKSVYEMRDKLRGGWTPRQTDWSPDEILILKASTRLTLSAIAEMLPGRTLGAVRLRLARLGLGFKQDEGSPNKPGARTILAKTCLYCGSLLAGTWFTKTSCRGYVGKHSYCRKCTGTATNDWRRKERAKGNRYDNASHQIQQRITLALATRNGEEYIEKDFEVLADKSKTVLGKALELKRTYRGVSNAVSRYGFSSRKPLGDPYAERWIIDNPSAPEAVAITAAFKAAIDNGIIPAPEWDWDDHDLEGAA